MIEFRYIPDEMILHKYEKVFDFGNTVKYYLCSNEYMYWTKQKNNEDDNSLTLGGNNVFLIHLLKSFADFGINSFGHINRYAEMLYDYKKLDKIDIVEQIKFMIDFMEMYGFNTKTKNLYRKKNMFAYTKNFTVGTYEYKNVKNVDKLINVNQKFICNGRYVNSFNVLTFGELAFWDKLKKVTIDDIKNDKEFSPVFDSITKSIELLTKQQQNPPKRPNRIFKEIYPRTWDNTPDYTKFSNNYKELIGFYKKMTGEI